VKARVNVGVAADLAAGELSAFLARLPEPDISPHVWLLTEAPALIARVDDELAGIGVVRKHGLHPGRAWASVLVAPETRRRAIGSTLLGALIDASATPLKSRLGPGATAGRAFAEALRLRVLVKSHLVELDAAKHRVAPSPAPADFEIGTVEAVEPAFRSAVAALYRRIHAWDPPGSSADREIADRLLTDVAFALAARRAGSIIGVGVAHHGEAPRLEAAMIGTVERDESCTPVTRTLLAELLEQSGALEVEVDEGKGAHDELFGVVTEIAPRPWGEPTLIVSTD